VEMTISPSWAYCIDFGGKNSGSVSAAMNMAGSFGALASANAFPLLHRWTGDSGTYFRLAAALNILAIVCWLGMPSILGQGGGAVPAAKVPKVTNLLE